MNLILILYEPKNYLEISLKYVYIFLEKVKIE